MQALQGSAAVLGLYLLVTKDLGLTYSKHAICGIHGHIIAAGRLEVFSDASFAELINACSRAGPHQATLRCTAVRQCHGVRAAKAR